MTKSQELAKNTLIIAVGKLFTQLLTFLLLPIYTFFLTPADYGMVDLILTYVLLLTPLATLQVERATFRYLIDSRSDRKKIGIIITNSFIILTLGAMIACIVILACNLFYSIPLVVLAALLGIATIYSSLLQQIARGMGKNKTFSIGSIITGIFQVVFVIIFIVYLKYGAEGILIASIIANAAGITYFIYSTKCWRYIRISNFDKSYSRSLLSYSMPLVPSNLAWWVINVSDRTIISIFMGMTANGMYAISARLSSILTMLYAIYDMSWTESVSLHINSEDRHQFFSSSMDQALRFFSSVGALLVGGIAMAFPYIVGKAYNEAYYYIPILVLGALFGGIVSQYSALYIATKETKKVASSSIGAALINLVITLFGIHFIGIYAAAFATVISFLAMAIYRHYDTKKYVTITYKKSTFISLCIAYLLIAILYYQNTVACSIATLFIAIGFTVFVNQSLFKNGFIALKNRR